MTRRLTIFATCYDKKGRYISSAINSYKKTHPLQKYFADKVGHKDNIYLHAEIAALIKAGTQKVDSIVITRRYKNTSNLALAKPCPICLEALKAFKVKHIFYSTEEGMVKYDPTEHQIL